MSQGSPGPTGLQGPLGPPGPRGYEVKKADNKTQHLHGSLYLVYIFIAAKRAAEQLKMSKK